jgi:predicted membrane metal-binding protein
MQAIVCGTAIHSPSLRNEFRDTGLIHLLVVSGSHLVCLELLLSFILKHWKFKDLALLIVFVLFALITSGQPPIMRAIASNLLGRGNKIWRLCWTRTQIALMSGFFTLPFCHGQSGSLSLLLSWSASLILAELSTSPNERSDPCLSRLIHWRNLALSALRLHSLMYVFLLPLLLPLSAPHPLSILSNWILGPVLGFVLFPISALGFLAGGLNIAATICDRAWAYALSAVGLAAEQVPPALKPIPFAPIYSWLYVTLLGVGFLMRESTRRQHRLPRRK